MYKMINSVLGKRSIEVNNEEQNKKRKIEKASHFLNHIQNKIKNNKPLTDEQYEAIPKALSNIPIEEHYKWPEFASLEALDGGKRKTRRIKRKTKKVKRKSRKYNK